MKISPFLVLVTVLTIGLFFHRPSVASDTCDNLNIAAAKIPHFIESNAEGVFVNLMNTAAKRANLNIKISVFPKKRAVEFFQMGSANVLLPHSSAGDEIPSYKSLPLLIKRDFAFVRNGTTPPDSLQNLAGLSIGLTAQYAYPKSLTERKDLASIVLAPTDVMNIKMLSNNRFDVSIIEETSGLKAIQTAEADNIIYDKNHPLTEFFVWALFQKTPCGLQLSEKINAAFEEMKLDGTWNSIFKGPLKQSLLVSSLDFQNHQ